MSNILIAVKIPETLKQQIENFIKTNYPRYKTYSQVVREALTIFLEGNKTASLQGARGHNEGEAVGKV
jgi:Arc/MetJ-type ribon-helix-helix transcriptional regulator